MLQRLVIAAAFLAPVTLLFAFFIYDMVTMSLDELGDE